MVKISTLKHVHHIIHPDKLLNVLCSSVQLCFHISRSSSGNVEPLIIQRTLEELFLI